MHDEPRWAPDGPVVWLTLPDGQVVSAVVRGRRRASVPGRRCRRGYRAALPRRRV
ncbi:hypothetical protein [Streptomyces johnsoniae]|uniref:Uncharacterized protein n=1 Tax=Streptomyces johnsoniae TaxID=3075532 RepID=A0ABU2S7L3_9ACTN|nr:hypothetical protein [Streptomyces sp. DSM 41886]MDT0444661.1 hypothetical protein [Streptomyces sp. DSM 41886]